MPRWADDRIEVNLGQLIDDGRWMLEIVAPAYPMMSVARDAFVRQVQEIRLKVFGYVEVIDLSNVPIDTPGLIFPDTGVLLAEIYEPEIRRMRYQFVGKPTLGFDEADVTWGGQLAIDAPKKEIATKKFYCHCCGYATLEEQDGWEICPVCFWEDDPVHLGEEDYPMGANDVSLRQARINYEAFQASEERLKQYVRRPVADEKRDPSAPYASKEIKDDKQEDTTRFRQAEDAGGGVGSANAEAATHAEVTRDAKASTIAGASATSTIGVLEDAKETVGVANAVSTDSQEDAWSAGDSIAGNDAVDIR